jgi:hypothetical protein
MRRGGGSSALRLAAAAAALLVLALALAQVLLPGIAASRISSRVGRYGSVQSVHVSAWPAVKLLWGDADEVRVRARSLSMSPRQAAALLWEGRGAGRLELSAASLRLGALQLQDASLSGRDGVLSARASTTAAQAQAALPAGVGARLIASVGGSVEVLASGRLFGVGVGVRALAQPRGGALVVHPSAPLLAGLQLTLFSDPHVYLLAVGAQPLARQPPAYLLTLRARLR